ncbi:uncharacterized protein AB9X84_020246 [Acanthopagrus schlegelii]
MCFSPLGAGRSPRCGSVPSVRVGPRGAGRSPRCGSVPSVRVGPHGAGRSPRCGSVPTVRVGPLGAGRSPRCGSVLTVQVGPLGAGRSPRCSTCFLPPIVQPTGVTGKPGVDEVQRQKVMRPSHPTSLAQYEQQRKVEDNRSLLEELSRIEAELRQSVRLDVERQQEAEFLRQQENKQLRTHLCYLSLSQRVAKPWVSSYFRKFPMHIYCLPVQAANHRARRRGLIKRK